MHLRVSVNQSAAMTCDANLARPEPRIQVAGATRGGLNPAPLPLLEPDQTLRRPRSESLHPCDPSVQLLVSRPGAKLAIVPISPPANSPFTTATGARHAHTHQALRIRSMTLGSSTSKRAPSIRLAHFGGIGAQILSRVRPVGATTYDKIRRSLIFFLHSFTSPDARRRSGGPPSHTSRLNPRSRTCP
jgi:hypothetical protein